jgi:hypothetical protein
MLYSQESILHAPTSRQAAQMKIFVAYGYNDRDQWIPNLVFPIIKAFGDEVITGEQLQGDQITDAVIREIRQSDALIAFVTRRQKIDETRWTTHRWVTDEVAHALAYRLLIAEIRENGVDEQGGIVGDRQRIIYNENEREKCLVEIVKILGKWHSTDTVRLQLLPDECVQAIRPLLRNPGLRCTYKILDNDGELGEEIPATILPITGGLFVHAKNVPRLSLIQLRVECSDKSWTSNFENTDSLSIPLHEE